MRPNALENVDQVVVGIDLVQAASGDQTLDDSDVFGAKLCPGEEPVATAHRYHTQSALQMVRVHLDIRNRVVLAAWEAANR